jgi:NTE family protein
MTLIHEAVDSIKKIFTAHPPGIVLALGGGGAPGLAHIGVLQVLAESAIPVRAIVGTSVGAEIGAFIANGMPVSELAEMAIGFDWKQTLQLFMPDLAAGGLSSGVNVMKFLSRRLGAVRIENLSIGFAAVATDLETGEQVVLDRGELIEAVRASISVPGLLTPYRIDGRMLVDGGVLNPLPFDVARERFGGPVVAVAVHASARGLKHPVPLTVPSSQWPVRVRQLLDQSWMARAPALRTWLEEQLDNYQKKNGNGNNNQKSYWTTRRVLDRALDITEAEIVRLRVAADPPDLVLTPEVDGIGLLEFYSAEEAIVAGRRAAEANLPELKQLLDS